MSARKPAASLPPNQHGEPPSRPEPRRVSWLDGGKLLWEREEIVRFGQADSQAKHYAVIRYRQFKTDEGERFEAQAWPRRSVPLTDQPYNRNIYNLVEIYVEPAQKCAWLGPKGMILMTGETRGAGLGSYLL